MRVVKTIWNRYSLTDLFDELIITPTQNKNIYLLDALYKLRVREKNYNSETFTTYSKESRMRKTSRLSPLSQDHCSGFHDKNNIKIKAADK